MKVAEIMTRNVRVVSPDKTIREAARLMDEMNVGVLPVCDGRRLRGMVTDRDITVKVVAQGADPSSTRVSTLITRKPTVIREDAGILDATKLLSRRGIRRLPVVSKTGKLVGIIALDDRLMLLGSELGHIASTLASELGRTRI